MSVIDQEEFRLVPPFPQFRLRTSSSPSERRRPNPSSSSPPPRPSTLPVNVRICRHELHRWFNLSADGDEHPEGRVTRTLLQRTLNPSSAPLTLTASFHPSMFLFPDAAHRSLSPMLSALGLNLDPSFHHTLIDCVIEYARQNATSLVVVEIVIVTDHVRDETELNQQAAAAAAAEMGLRMVPAGERAVQELLDAGKATVEREEEECVICMEGLPRGSEATRMPCSHWFHGDCIRRWLECSHYCPLCRFSMPTDPL